MRCVISACEMSSVFEIPLLRYCEKSMTLKWEGKREMGFLRDASSSTLQLDYLFFIGCHVHLVCWDSMK